MPTPHELKAFEIKAAIVRQLYYILLRMPSANPFCRSILIVVVLVVAQSSKQQGQRVWECALAVCVCFALSLSLSPSGSHAFLPLPSPYAWTNGALSPRRSTGRQLLHYISPDSSGGGEGFELGSLAQRETEKSALLIFLRSLKWW